MVSQALGLVGPHSRALRLEALWEGPLGARPRVSVRTQDAGRPYLPALRQEEGQAEVRARASGSVGPTILARGAFEGLRGLRGPYPFSHPE